MTAIRHLPRPVIALALALLLVFGGARAASPDAAASFVRELGDKAIKRLADDESPIDKRVDKFRELLREHFAMTRISRFVLGRYWRTASEAERERFRRTLERVLANRFVPMFRDYSKGDFVVKGGRTDPNSSKLYLVDTRIKDPTSGNMITTHWRIAHKNDEFRVLDVKAEGVSMAITLRSEYSSVIRRNNGSISALIERMKATLPDRS